MNFDKIEYVYSGSVLPEKTLTVRQPTFVALINYGNITQLMINYNAAYIHGPTKYQLCPN